VTPLKDVKVTAQSTVTLTCDLDPGEPKANIKWYKESRELYEGKKHNMSYSGNKAKLVISQADLSDSAIYRVEADNRHGRVMSEAKIFVQGILTLLLCRLLQQMLLQRGLSVCHVYHTCPCASC